MEINRNERNSEVAYSTCTLHTARSGRMRSGMVTSAVSPARSMTCGA